MEDCAEEALFLILFILKRIMKNKANKLKDEVPMIIGTSGLVEGR